MASDIPPVFKLGRFFAEYESQPDLLPMCCSDPESWKMQDLLKLASKDTRALWDDLSLCYTESQGLPQLLREAALLHGVESSDVLLIAPGEGIYIAMSCLVTYLKKKHGLEKFHVITTFPGYQSLYDNLRTAKCDVGQWTARDTGTEWQFQLDELKNLIREDTKLLVVNFPHNPTGYMPGADMWQDIVDLCGDKDIFLFSDEMYRLTNNDGSEPLPSASALSENAVTLFGMSKSFGLPGLRLGWLCTNNKDLMALMQRFKDYVSYCASAPSEILALVALQNRDTVITNTMDIVNANLSILEEFFQKFPDVFEWYRPNACTTGFLKLKGWLLNDLGCGSASQVCMKLVSDARVLLIPGATFDFADQYVRLGLGKKTLPDGLKRLEEFLQKNQPQK